MNDTWWIAQEQLDDEQKDILELPLRKSHIILGPPGSGKTNLLLLRANFSTLAGRRDVEILVFTRILREFIAAGGHTYAFDPQLVSTTVAWFLKFIKFHGGDIPDVRDRRLLDCRRILLDAANETLERRCLGKVYETIFVDEAQDMLEGELQLFDRIAEDLFLVGDSRQQIYRAGDPFQVLNHLQVHRLTHNYRNGHAICRVADRIGAVGDGDYQRMEDTSNYNEKSMPSSVDITPCPDLPAQIDAVLLRIEKQLDAYPGEPIGVIGARREDVLRFWDAVAKSALANKATLLLSEEGSAFGDNKPIGVSTVHSTKGLEFRCVHLIAAEALRTFPLGHNVAFTAVTRAKTVLSVYHSGYLPPFLKSALLGDEESTGIPSLDALFRSSGEVK